MSRPLDHLNVLKVFTMIHKNHNYSELHLSLKNQKLIFDFLIDIMHSDLETIIFHCLLLFLYITNSF